MFTKHVLVSFETLQCLFSQIQVATLEKQVQQLMLAHTSQKTDNHSQKQQGPVHSSEFTVSVNITGVEDSNVKRVPFDTPVNNAELLSTSPVSFLPDMSGMCHNMESRGCMPIREGAPYCKVKGNAANKTSYNDDNQGCPDSNAVKKTHSESPQPSGKLSEQPVSADSNSTSALVVFDDVNAFKMDITDLENFHKDSAHLEYEESIQEYKKLELEGDIS